MAKQSRTQRARRAAQREDTKRIEAAWQASVPAARAKEFAESVAAAHARGAEKPRPDMAPGTRPNPPRPGREPKPPKDASRKQRSY